MKNSEICDCNVLHKENVELSKKSMPDNESILNVSKLCKVLGDKTRCKIAFSLLNQELCVCDISYLLNMTKSAISHQLAIMKEVYIVKSRRVGKSVFYSIDDDHVFDILSVALYHMQHKEH